jgi:hypothetical protein
MRLKTHDPWKPISEIHIQPVFPKMEQIQNLKALEALCSLWFFRLNVSRILRSIRGIPAKD